VGRHLFDIDQALLRQRMPARHDHAERFLIDHARDDARLAERQRHHDPVQVATPQLSCQTDCEVLLEEQRHPRCARVQGRNQLRQQVRRYGVDDTQAQRAL